MKKLVISATNLVEGGGLRVLRDCVDAAARRRDQVATTVLVNDRALLGRDDVEIIEVPDAKRSWWRRVDTEYRRFRPLSEKLSADIWLSLHDITPTVVAGRQYVYCHNPAPFYRVSLRQAWQEPAFAAFNLLYDKLYRINIHRNHAVIVQQRWLRDEFVRRYNVPLVLTAAPDDSAPAAAQVTKIGPARVFLYPALPRAFKNMEVLCAAVRLLRTDPEWRGEVRLTIDGHENRYARWIARQAADLSQIKLISRQTQDGMARQYAEADVVLFPSTLETWGLPITEAKALGKPVFLADLPYAHETLGWYDGAQFIAPNDATAWADALRDADRGRYRFASIEPAGVTKPDLPNWDALMSYLIEPSAVAAPGIAA